jgi:hypothetical protein
VDCPKCGAENSEDAVYCFNCGNQLKAVTVVTPQKKNSLPLIISGCFVFFLLGLFCLAGASGLYYYFFYKKPAKKSVLEKVVNTGTASQEFEEKSPKEATEALVRKVVVNFYTALQEGKFEEAGNFVNADAKKDWYLPEIQGQGDAQLTDFKILSVSWVRDSVYEVIVKETYEGFEGRSYETLSYSVLKKGNKWLIDDVEFVAESFDFTPDSAISTVGEFLNAIKEHRMNDARGMVTENFIAEQGEDFFIDPGYDLFQQFEVLKAEEEGDYYWVYTREVWNSGPENMKYKVITTEGGLFIDSMSWVE